MAQASAEKLEQTGPAEKERVASVPRREHLASTSEPPLLMREEEFKVGKSRTLARERGIIAGAWRRKGRPHSERMQIPSRKGRASNKSLPRRSRRKHKQVSGHKSSPGRSAESWFHS